MTITLKTLPQATAQEVFDQVATHLATQDRKAHDPVRRMCLYRTPDGLRCAAGCLIADDEYNAKWEGVGWSVISEENDLDEYHYNLISDLQGIHDECKPVEWAAHLADLAETHELSADILDTLRWPEV